jgi:O-antigen/teichoic acid export membrane protein
VFLAASFLASGVALLGSSFIADTFINGAQARHDVVLDSVRLGALILFTSLLGSFASAALSALGRLQFLVAVRLIFGTLASVVAVAVIAAGGGLRGVLLGQVVITAALCVAQLVALRSTTHARLRPGLHRATFRTMARFGASILLAGLFYQALMQGPPTILAGHSTTDQVAAFAVPSVILQQLIVLTTVTSLGFLPFASAESAAADPGRLVAVFLANLRMTVLAIGPIVAYLVIWGHPLLATWIDRGFADDAIGPLRYLAGAAVLVALSAPAADVARGLNRPSWTVAYTGGASAISVAAGLLLVGRHGATGVAAALGLALVLATLPFVVVVARRLLGLGAADLARALAAPTVAVAVAAAVFAGGRLLTAGIGGAIAAGAAGVLVYAAVIVRGVLDDRERAVLGGLLPARIRGGRGGPPQPTAMAPSESAD